MQTSDDRDTSKSLSLRLGWVSFFNDCSSEILARALPLYLVTVIGATPTSLGVIEGLAESMSIFLRILSGWWSDKMASRKPLIVFGYAASAVSRVALLFSQQTFGVGVARIFDRTGKGLRTAPRDAMVADASAAHTAGRNFGITRFLDTLGAVTGIAIALAFGIGTNPMTATEFNKILLVSVPFAFIALLFLILVVPRVPRLVEANKLKLSLRIPHNIRSYLAIVFVFSLASSSDAFIVLRAKDFGLSFRETLIALLGFNLLAALLSVPAGRLSDRFGRVRFLALAWLIYAFCYAMFAMAPSAKLFIASLLFYGCFYGFSEGVEKALLADLLPPENRGVGFGALQFVVGLAALPASLLMGSVMTAFGAQTAFLMTAVVAMVAAGALIVWRVVSGE